MRSKIVIGSLALASVMAAWAQRPDAKPPAETVVAQQVDSTLRVAVADHDAPLTDLAPLPSGNADLERYALTLAGLGVVLLLVSRREKD